MMNFWAGRASDHFDRMAQVELLTVINLNSTSDGSANLSERWLPCENLENNFLTAFQTDM